MTASATTPAHIADAPLVTSRRGSFWIPGEIVELAFGTVQRGPMFVEWECPETVTQPHPVVLVHGGGGQGADWTSTVDGKPGWAAKFVDAGYTTYVVDRVGHGRSPLHPDLLGEMSPPAPYFVAQALFAPADRAAEHTRWPWGRDAGSPEMDQAAASGGPMIADLPHAQELDASRLVALLEKIGRSVLVTHSAGAPSGWLAADRRPDLVAGIAAVEPLGPAFVDFPGIGELEWGITAVPLRFRSAPADPQEIRAEDADVTTEGLGGIPVAVFTGTASNFREAAPSIVDFLSRAGAHASWIDLGSLGIKGNGHGLIFESNAHETVVPVLDWIGSHCQ